tara:strand:+ start:170 stop:307 length:138 start_codon:yes stop_codon:yes gene_type:complete
MSLDTTLAALGTLGARDVFGLAKTAPTPNADTVRKSPRVKASLYI